MGQRSCTLNIANTINAPDNFARVYTGNHPTHYPRGLQPHIREEQNSLRQNIVTDLEMTMQPVFRAYMQETQV